MKSITDNLNISLLDLLSILLPGITAEYFLLQILKSDTNQINILTDIEPDWIGAVFYFGIAYFLGYVIYVLSSFLDSFYDNLKNRALEMNKTENQMNGLKILKPSDFKKRNLLSLILFPNLIDTHNLIVKVVELKNRDIGTDLDGDEHQTINAYQYAFRRLMAQQASMFSEVERYYATARFFRSMTVVLFGGAVILLLPFDKQAINSLWVFLFAIISLFVYLDRWRKAQHVAFKNVIILEGLKKK